MGLRQEVAVGQGEMSTAGLEPGSTFRDCDDVCPEMVVIPPGEFLMGSPEDEIGRLPDEGPQHEVTITEPFALCTTEVTFAEWDACFDAGGCDHKPSDEGWGRGNRPVINVSWNDTKQYLDWLSKKTGAAYRLPSESEWEYAARAGSTTPFWTGERITTDEANFDGRYPYIGISSGEIRQQPLPVRSLPANPFGLFEVHGNVWEWVEDRYHQNYSGAPKDGSPWGAAKSTGRILRGGSWSFHARDLRSAVRTSFAPDMRNNGLGLRCARGMESTFRM